MPRRDARDAIVRKAFVPKSSVAVTVLCVRDATRRWSTMERATVCALGVSGGVSYLSTMTTAVAGAPVCDFVRQSRAASPKQPKDGFSWHGVAHIFLSCWILNGSCVSTVFSRCVNGKFLTSEELEILAPQPQICLRICRMRVDGHVGYGRRCSSQFRWNRAQVRKAHSPTSRGPSALIFAARPSAV